MLEEQIGAGGMAVVFRARDELLGRLAALKVIAPALASDQEFRARFIRESRAVALVDEPHIIPVYAAGDAGGVLFIATRYVPGGDLGALVWRSGGTLSPDRAVELIAQVASALDAAHAADLVHRDVKPGNILVDIVPGRPEHAYLSDFGLSKGIHASTGLTATGQFLGTLDYCAPEQITAAHVDGRTDQYALACVAFTLLSGTPPFRRPEPAATIYAQLHETPPALSAARPWLPSAVDAVLARGLAKDPAHRFRSCAEFAAALRTALTPAPPTILRSAAGTFPARDARDSFPTGPGNTALAATTQGLEPDAPVWRAPEETVHEPRRRHRRPRLGVLRFRRRTAVIAAAAAVVLATAGAITALELPGSHAPSPVPPGGTTTHAILAATITAPGGDSFYSARYSPDGALLATGDNPADGQPGRLYVWDAVTGKLRTTFTASGGLLIPWAFDRHDTTLTVLFFTLKSAAIYQFDLSTGRRTTLLSGMNVPENWAVSGDGFIVAAAGTSASRMIIEVAMNVPQKGLVQVDKITYPGKNLITGSLWLDDAGLTLVASDENGTTYVWNTTTGKLLDTLHYVNRSPAPGYSARTPKVGPDGKVVDTSSNNGGPLTIWDVATHANVTPHDARWQQDVGGEYSQDGRYFATISRDSKTVSLWDLATRSYVASVTDSSLGQLTAYALGPGGTEVALGSTGSGSYQSTRQLRLWKIPVKHA